MTQNNFSTPPEHSIRIKRSNYTRRKNDLDLVAVDNQNKSDEITVKCKTVCQTPPSHTTLPPSSRKIDSHVIWYSLGVLSSFTVPKVNPNTAQGHLVHSFPSFSKYWCLVISLCGETGLSVLCYKYWLKYEGYEEKITYYINAVA